MFKWTCFLALLGVFSAPLALHASSFNFTISTGAANGDPATTFVASGVLTGPADPFVDGAFDITSITGSANGFDILGVVNPGATNTGTTNTVSGFTFNNVLYVNDPHVDANGVLLDLSSPIGVSLAHVYFTGITPQNPGGYEVDVVDPNEPGAVTPFAIKSFDVSAAPTSSPTAIPEPSTLLLLGTGIAGLGRMVSRRKACHA